MNWYDWSEDKKESSYESRLQFDIDKSYNTLNQLAGFYLKWNGMVMK